MDYNKLAATTKRLIDAKGRTVQFYKLDSTPVDPLRPWVGAGTHTPTDVVITKAVFAIGNTSIPTESRGLAFDWVDKDLLRVTRHVVLVPALGLPSLQDYKLVTDLGKNWGIIWGQLLQPGDVPLMYCFGLKE